MTGIVHSSVRSTGTYVCFQFFVNLDWPSMHGSVASTTKDMFSKTFNHSGINLCSNLGRTGDCFSREPPYKITYKNLWYVHSNLTMYDHSIHLLCRSRCWTSFYPNSLLVRLIRSVLYSKSRETPKSLYFLKSVFRGPRRWWHPSSCGDERTRYVLYQLTITFASS